MKPLLIILLLTGFSGASAQYSNTLDIAVPFLLITPDARGAAMGEAGVATSPDVHSIFWNTAKLAFIENKFGVSVTYTPWIREIRNDIYLLDASSYWKIDSLNAVTGSFRHFDLGKITFTNASGAVVGNFQPVEWTCHGGYARKITGELSAGINLGYVRSNLATGFSVNNFPIMPGHAVMADLSLFFSHPVRKQSAFRKYNLALTVSNLGNKITYTQSNEHKDFLPANLSLGSNFDFQLGKKHQLSLALDFNKLLVPTPDSGESYLQQSVLEGTFSSIADAPNGFSEELNEVTVSSGMEYWYNQMIALRAGYFYEAPSKGSRQYFAFGAGAQYSFMTLEISYMLNTSSNGHPLNNMWRAGLAANFGSMNFRSSKKS